MLRDIMEKDTKLVIGLMSGTSGDGVDAVLCEIRGHGISTRVKQLAFVSPAYTREVRDRILQVAAGDFGGAKELCLMNVYLSELFADACLELCRQAEVKPGDIDLIGTHGQTVYHIPVAENYLGRDIRATLQIGEASTLVERIGAVTVSDFRVRDMAAGGLGAPLVPYTEYILYSDPEHNMGLQNIGGIGNITVIPKNARLEELTAFDTGPGNMVMDNVIYRLTKGKMSYDAGGRMAASGSPSGTLLEELMRDPYLAVKPPKTTGREYYGNEYVDRIMKRAEELELSGPDTLATVTMFTARSIAYSARELCPVCPDRLVVGGGGSLNPTLMKYIADSLPEAQVMTNEDLGFDSSAKEAVAFALLANECIHSMCNNAVAATGAHHPVVMGKISQ
ncbi:MAG: anhydro-N-acetylmuramic acid kinase [Lachnospiraceae bacterium]|nr:anhydro-N-acetylmuramic acid kinase [Lachnospiraceae bacterium]